MAGRCLAAVELQHPVVCVREKGSADNLDSLAGLAALVRLEDTHKYFTVTVFQNKNPKSTGSYTDGTQNIRMRFPKLYEF